MLACFPFVICFFQKVFGRPILLFRKRGIQCFPNPRPRHVASRGTTRAYCEEKSEHRVCLLGRYLLAVARAFMHSFRGKLRVVTSPDITFGAAKFQHQKKFWLSEIWPSGLSPGVLIRPAPLQLLRLVQ